MYLSVVCGYTKHPVKRHSETSPGKPSFEPDAPVRALGLEHY